MRARTACKQQHDDGNTAFFCSQTPEKSAFYHSSEKSEFGDEESCPDPNKDTLTYDSFTASVSPC